MQYKIKDLTGKKFGKLTVIEPTGDRKSGSVVWKCLCECGRYAEIASSNLGKSTKTCGCSRIGNSNGKKPLQQASKNKLYKHYIYKANQKSLDFYLSFEQFITMTSQPCYYCGRLPSNEGTSGKDILNGYYIYNGIDRVDNLIGYTLENSVSCCKQCNWSKRDFTKEEFYMWIKQVYNNLDLGRAE